MRTQREITRRIAFIGYDGVQALDVVGPMEVFAAANMYRPQHVPPYELILASPKGGSLSCSSAGGIRLGDAVALEALPGEIDTLIIAGGSEDGIRKAIFETNLINWLTSRASRTRRLASVCTGAFVLAAGGFLDGKRATTHWNSVDLLRELRPEIEVEPDAIFVAEPPVYTSAGITAGIDLCLALVEDDCGAQTALSVSRQLVLFMRRAGGQAQFNHGLATPLVAEPRLRSLMNEILADPTGDLSGPALASRIGMSERTFSRSFRRETGTTPAQFVEDARINRAKMLLETSDWPLARIAERSGFGSFHSLHRAFQKRLGVTPGFYRDRFGLN
ncbi:GlxA family transcriptional regulator [Rhizobium oryzicola]|uniref:Helix-turn-helix domain-containing protein n=1 Tax=Rhizobium oryzicola TaxID=1232668 RepID=A0ABT8T4Q0_9HYPH|nr:helix-turn-helix domain-containing protein [Rhizobium oryzicola]MDO1585440.1 helix-turn-helix domain-containing protein [Rhizobium oryzicola]